MCTLRDELAAAAAKKRDDEGRAKVREIVVSMVDIVMVWCQDTSSLSLEGPEFGVGCTIQI